MPKHIVVDGSNLATEGRALPSLKQLNEAVLAYMEENPDDIITVVVDATFGHRIDPREVPEFDAAIENNELVAPPAGAIGRGDAFVLTIANKVQATIISNDSYQEFHGDYDWLFDEGRLVGGKPVPNVGWVFVPRVPVRGPVSRRAVKDARRPSKAVSRTSGREPRKAGRASKEASRPMPVPAAPPPGMRSHSAPSPSAEPSTPSASKAQAESKALRGPKPADQTDAPTASRPHMVNELLPFLGFVEQHPMGSTVAGVVESYSSHGAYVALGDARGYVPLRLMADPPPRSAREMMKLGETVDLVVVSFNATRRSIDLSVPGMEPPEVKALAGKPAKRTRKKAAAPVAVDVPVLVEMSPALEAPPLDALPPRAEIPVKRTRKKAATPAADLIPPEPVVAPAPESREKPSRRLAAPAKTAAKVAPTKRAAPTKAAPTKAAPTKRAPPTKAASTKAASTKAASTKAASTKAATAKTGSKAVPTKAAAAKRAGKRDGP